MSAFVWWAVMGLSVGSIPVDAPGLLLDSGEGAYMGIRNWRWLKATSWGLLIAAGVVLVLSVGTAWMLVLIIGGDSPLIKIARGVAEWSLYSIGAVVSIGMLIVGGVLALIPAQLVTQFGEPAESRILSDFSVRQPFSRRRILVTVIYLTMAYVLLMSPLVRTNEYFAVLRWIVTGVAIVAYFDSARNGEFFTELCFAGTAILFCPFLHWSFQRPVWEGIDIGAAAFFVLGALLIPAKGRSLSEDSETEVALSLPYGVRRIYNPFRQRRLLLMHRGGDERPWPSAAAHDLIVVSGEPREGEWALVERRDGCVFLGTAQFAFDYGTMLLTNAMRFECPEGSKGVSETPEYSTERISLKEIWGVRRVIGTIAPD